MKLDLNYDDLMIDLQHGRELEFVWKGSTFAISCDFPNKWFLAIPAAGVVIEDDNVVNLMKKVKFGLESFRDIVPKISESTLF